jgi:peptidoglycan/LPS O-acetylase OafA/YrhL
MSRSRPLDGLRGIAVLAVMAVHTNISLGQAGYLGVDIFFVLSGYLITTILLRERERSGRISLGGFYARRALRLYPALVALVLVSLLIPTIVGFATRGNAFRAAPIILGYLGDFAVFSHWSWNIDPFRQVWTLGIEEQFYLLWPAFVILTMRSRFGLRATSAAATLGAGYGLVSMITLAAGAAHPGRIVYFRPDIRAGAILVGCALALALEHRRVRGDRITLPSGIGWVAAGLLAADLVAGPNQLKSSAYTLAIPAAWVLSATLIAEFVTSPERLLARLVGARILAAVGVISYGLYLIHPIVFEYFSRQGDLKRHIAMPLAATISLVLAIISYQVIEKPFLRLKSRWSSTGAVDAGLAVPELVP